DRLFSKAAEIDSERAATQYALALTNFSLGTTAFRNNGEEAGRLHLSRALEFCDRALEVRAPAEESAHVLALKGYVLWLRAWRVWAGSPIQNREFRDARVFERRAISSAWSTLCRASTGWRLALHEQPAALEHARRVASQLLHTWAQCLLELAAVNQQAAAQ